MDPKEYDPYRRRDGVGEGIGTLLSFLTMILIGLGTAAAVSWFWGWAMVPTAERLQAQAAAARLDQVPQFSPTASALAPVTAVAGTSTPSPVTTAAPAAVLVPVPTGFYLVGNTGGDGVWLQREPRKGAHLKAWRVGTRVREIGQPVEAEGWTWRHVRDPLGNEGYMPAQWLIAEKRLVEAGVVPTPPAATAAPTVTTTPTPSPETPRYYYVGNTGGVGVSLRRTPNLNDRMVNWVDGTRMEVIGPEVQAGGLVWRHLRDPRGNEGYIPAQWLVEGQ